MNAIVTIGYRQFAWVIASVITAGGLLILPREDFRAADADAWLAFSLPLLYVLYIMFVFSKLVKYFPGKNLFQIVTITMGNKIGGAVNAVILFYIWSVLLRDFSAINFFLKTMILQNTPGGIIILLLLLLAMYFAHHGVETTVRVNDMLFPFFIIFMLSLPLLLSNQMELSRLKPILTSSPGHFLAAHYLNSGWFGDIGILGGLLHTVSQSEKVKSSVRYGGAITTFMLTILFFVMSATLGPILTSKAMFSIYMLAEQINITEFLDRVEIIIFSVWFPVTIVKISIIYLIFLIGLSNYIGSVRPQHFNTAVGLKFGICSLVAFENIDELFAFGNFSATVLSLGIMIPVTLALMLLIKAKENLGVEPEKMLEVPKMVKTLRLIGYGCVFLALASTAVGLFISKYYGPWGYYAALGYSLGITGFMVSSHLEFNLMCYPKNVQLGNGPQANTEASKSTG
ncbi:GerAB/ArcD/ProY family transporter [Paenibacillus turpanensis]|uniref:GerAB/ArcD/ProY family transporter n=1 Tax=Paenibacillus turpanensis TaxID=2689078 RepID=UPI001408EA50|nr:endospore germination permease [Paenibacillus turpanensis]